jgi:hypothetical protein
MLLQIAYRVLYSHSIIVKLLCVDIFTVKQISVSVKIDQICKVSDFSG